MPSKPADHLQAATWRLDAELLAAVREDCARRGEPAVTFVARALKRELHRCAAPGRSGMTVTRADVDTARGIVAHHQAHGISDQSVYCLDGAGAWRPLGPVEQYGHLLTHGPQYISVTSRTDPRVLAEQLATIRDREDPR